MVTELPGSQNKKGEKNGTGSGEAVRIPELSQSHRDGDKGTTGEISGRQFQWGLISEWRKKPRMYPSPSLLLGWLEDQEHTDEDWAQYLQALVNVCYLSPLHS